MKDPKSKKQQPWKPLTSSYCCSSEDQTIFRNISRCRPSKSELSKNIGMPYPSFRKLSFSDVSLGSSSARINEDLAQSFGGELYDFQLSELCGITQNFSSNFLLGEGGFGRVHKGYVDEKVLSLKKGGCWATTIFVFRLGVAATGLGFFSVVKLDCVICFVKKKGGGFLVAEGRQLWVGVGKKGEKIRFKIGRR